MRGCTIETLRELPTDHDADIIVWPLGLSDDIFSLVLAHLLKA